MQVLRSFTGRPSWRSIGTVPLGDPARLAEGISAFYLVITPVRLLASLSTVLIGYQDEEFFLHDG